MSAPAAAPHRTISQFCDHVCMYVRFRPDHEAITAELTAHLEDHKAAILETRPDMPLREAERRAAEAMGYRNDQISFEVKEGTPQIKIRQ